MKNSYNRLIIISTGVIFLGILNYLILNSSVSDLRWEKELQQIKSLLTKLEQQKAEKKNQDVQLEELRHFISSIPPKRQPIKIIQEKNGNDTLFLAILKQLDSIHNIFQKQEYQHQTPDISVFYKRKDSTEVGEKVHFVITGPVGEIINFHSQSAKINRAYSINASGEFITENTPAPQTFPLNHPVEAFTFSQEKIGTSQVYIHTSQTKDTIITRYCEKKIKYKLDSIKLTHNPKNNQVSFNILFFPEVPENIEVNLQIILKVNSHEEKISKTLFIPEGTSEYRKEVTYPFSGRTPYQFKIEKINIVKIEGKSKDITYLPKDFTSF